MKMKLRVLAILIVAVALTSGTVPAAGTANVHGDGARETASNQADEALAPTEEAKGGERYCVDPNGDPFPCHPKRWAKKKAKKFKRGKLGKTRNKWYPKKLKRKIRRQARKKGYLRQGPGDRRPGWGDWWDGFKNAADCVAPGAEAACAKDMHDIKKLKHPGKVVLACGGSAAIIYWTGGTGGAVAGTGLGCSW